MSIQFTSLIRVAFWCGLTGYGGPALVGIIRNKFVEDHKWVEDNDFLNGLSLSQMLPGAFSVTLIGYLGYKLKGFRGAVLLPIFFLLPAVIFILSLSWAYFEFGNINFIQKIFIGLGALVITLLINATRTLGKSIFGKFDIKNYKGYLITLIIFSLGFFLKINVFYLIILSGLLGFVLYFWQKDFGNNSVPGTDVLINGNSSVPFYKDYSYYFILFSLLLLTGVYLYYPFIWKIFFTFFKIGLFGFGGGYTVIPLIQHQVVNELQWVTLNEFRDGIAMGQITPGPVFITTTFIGFKIAGIAGALVATIASYSPSLMAVVLLSKVLLKVKHKKIVQVFIKGILSGFIGLLLMVVVQFGWSSLTGWQTGLIFIVSSILIIIMKRDPIWALLATLLLTAILI
jgi:chromate transporter